MWSCSKSHEPPEPVHAEAWNVKRAGDRQENLVMDIVDLDEGIGYDMIWHDRTVKAIEYHPIASAMFPFKWLMIWTSAPTRTSGWQAMARAPKTDEACGKPRSPGSPTSCVRMGHLACKIKGRMCSMNHKGSQPSSCSSVYRGEIIDIRNYNDIRHAHLHPQDALSIFQYIPPNRQQFQCIRYPFCKWNLFLK